MHLIRKNGWRVVGFSLLQDGRAEVTLALYRSDSDFDLGAQPIGMDKVVVPANITQGDKDVMFAKASEWVSKDNAWSTVGRLCA